jgi:hypothetical protein
MGDEDNTKIEKTPIITTSTIGSFLYLTEQQASLATAMSLLSRHDISLSIIFNCKDHHPDLLLRS